MVCVQDRRVREIEILMQSKNRMRPQAIPTTAVFFAALFLSASSVMLAHAATPLQGASGQSTPATTAAPGSRITGTVTAISGNVLTVKDDKGVESKVTVQDSAKILQLPAGSRNLATAKPIAVADIAVGDRILAKTAPAEGGGFTASTVLAMKQADVAQTQQHEREEWLTRGISGVVKSVDPAAQTITVTTGNGAATKTVIVQASKSTDIRRYSPDSTKFDDAKSATFDQIKPEDQLRAKGDKNADATELAANAIVAGTFRNIAGTVVSVNPAANTVTVNDLATKKPFIVNVSTDSQLHKLSPMMAQGIAARLKGGSGASGGQGGPGGAAGHAPPGASAAPADSGSQASSGPSQGAPGQRGGGNLQQMLNRAPTIQLADLKPGDAIMVLTTEGVAPGAATAITLLAGVEPLLQASPGASQSVLSASWSLGGGAPGGDTQ
jgi:hypothetical protein